MKTTVYIVDDEPHALEILAGYIRRTPGLELAGTATEPLQALAEIRRDPPDLAFLDIDLPVITGLELAGMLPARTRAVISTSYREYGPEAFDHEVLDYLLKPYAYERFLAALRKFDAQRTPDTGPSGETDQLLLLKTGTKGKLRKIDTTAIVCIEGAQNYVRLHLADGEALLTNLTLQDLQERLPAAHFFRVHKSFIINLRRIRTFEQRRVLLDNQQDVPVGRSYQAAFQHRLAPLLLLPKKDRS
ncbi:LytR/AlgR family response regulator transcription factor [Mucilaginibacter ginsenosidivorans]|uniref:Response regulator transcription factor n=1 Tax=Mucilaginibacter ginsenosidivorans TaxID=398053 RepID=A0A5B8UW23_9SPHI|nr:LytTR family DNA-binding domain-containing protein [Mucilaginibacter ginsenosidivorans]QEC62531.1 response regulator transcription factor [Mucilaginibacter ginsenosidivorans]